MGPDYLAYAILDTAIDGYYPVLEAIGEKLEDLENLVIEDPRPQLAGRSESDSQSACQHASDDLAAT